jgi:nucleoside-diphosphate-sugar epimerase
VINRFIVQSLLNKPLTIYGKGDQKRGYLALNDSIQCLMLFIKNPAKGFRSVNQLAETFSINEIANMIKEINPETSFKYMKSPRVEITEDFYYNVTIDTLRNLGFKNTRNIKDELEYIYNLIDKEYVKYEKENYIK